MSEKKNHNNKQKVLYCGAAKKSIVPPPDIGKLFIAGYAGTYLGATPPMIKGVHDPIYVRTIILSDGTSKIALISVECIGLFLDFIKKIKNRLLAYDFVQTNIFIFATHTHAGSDTMGLWGPFIGKSGFNKKYALFLIDQIVDSVLEAQKGMKKAELYFSNSKLEENIKNYRVQEDINGDIKILKFMSNNQLIASLWTYSAQPEITTRENNEISADYPGLVSEMIEKKFGGISLFGLGISGAQSPIYCEQGYEKMELFANDLFSEINKVFEDHQKLKIEPIEIRYRKLKLRVDTPSFQFLGSIGGIIEREFKNNIINSSVSKIRIGKLHIINIPAEPFPGIVSKVIEENEDQEIMIISNVNDALGYFIPLNQYNLKPKEWAGEGWGDKFIGHEFECIGYEASETIRKTVEELFIYKTIMGIAPHADDLTIWAGGTIKKLTSEGNKLICVRITDDYGDCFGITKEQGIKTNRKEVERAYKALGAEEIIHLDYLSDTLAGVDYLELRGKLVYLMRKYKPDLVISFDLNGTDEENMDHIVTAKAVNEACWQSSFELYYPEHFDEGLEIHAIGERYLFARNPTVVNFHVDITDYIDDKIQAICKQRTVLKNFFHQYKLLARANRLHVELLEEDIPNAIRVNLLAKYMYGKIGEKYGVKYAEEFNKIGAGFLEDLAED